MKKHLLLLLAALAPLFAKVEVAATYPFIAELAQKVGGGDVRVTTLAKGNWDPHFVVPRPSLIRKVADADLLIINGAQLEIGWLPPLIRRANNPKVQPGMPGFLDLSRFVTLINKPAAVSRAGGDVHPDGNPHYATDPYNMPLLADAIAERLGRIDPARAEVYKHNAEAFRAAWQPNLARWQRQMAPFKGTKVIQYHELFNYFLKRYGLVRVGDIEPLPGIPPSPRHTLSLIDLIRAEHPCCILQDVYHASETAEYLRDKTGIRVLLLPHDVGATEQADSLTAFFDALTKSFAHD
jgi:zinc/manganese transport system substrate-binding protein